MNETSGNHTPAVSIGMPVYNGENYIQQAVDSLLAQTFTDFELIISDNHSTDDTEELCRAYAARDHRVRYHRADKNLGLARNFNRCVELARGEWFTWKCHDDVCAPTWLERCVETFGNDDELVWVHSRCRYIDERGDLIAGPDGPVEMSYLPAEAERATSGRSVVSRSASTPTRRFRSVLSTSDTGDFFGLYRTKVLRETRLHAPYYGGDQVLMAELSLHGTYAEVPDPLFFQRRHSSQSQWTRTARKQYELTAGRPAPWLLMPRRISCVLGRVGAISRSPIRLTQKLRCYVAVVSFVLHEKRWRRMAVDWLRGMGFGFSVPEDVIDPRRRPKKERSTSRQLAQVPD